MTRLLLMTQVPIWLGMVLLGGTGCATKADFGKLNQGLNQKLESLDSRVQAQVEVLRADLKAIQATHTKQYDELKTTLAAIKTDMATANMLTEYWSETMQGIKKVAASTDEVNEQLDGVRQLRVAVEQLPSLLAGLATKIHSLRQALLNSYKLEEAALRHRLSALEELGRQLEPTPQHAKKSE